MPASDSVRGSAHPSVHARGGRVIACLLVLGIFSSLASAQASDEGAWTAFAGQGRLGETTSDSRWRWWFDAHARFFDDSDGFDTGIVRPGIGYDLSEHTTAWLGYAWIRNDPPEGHFDEHRIWQQLTWGKRYGWGSPFLRTRLEQRFDERGGETGWRVRQFARWTRPVSEGSRLGWRAWDEIFVDLNDTGWGQDTGLRQNRAFAGLGWALGDSSQYTLEVGYLNQHLFREDARDDSNHVLAITLLGNF